MNISNQQINDFTEKELKISYWYVAHQAQMLAIVKILLIALCVIFWGYVFYGTINYFFIDQVRFDRAMSQLTAGYGTARLQDFWRPVQLELSDIKVMSSGANRYDFLVFAFNANKNWAVASIKYYFTYNGQQEAGIEPKIYEAFILPGQEKYLFDFGVEFSARPTNVGFEVVSIGWKHISNFEQLAAEKSLFTVSDIQFVEPSNTDSGINISKTKFKVRNDSVFNYWEMGFYILLYRGSDLAAINYVVLPGLASGESREAETLWYQNLSTPSKTEVIPDVDILNEKVFRQIEGGSGEKK
ncbi:MAG: hypothetical protein WC310_03880 [Patescibacteria group bacterium]|jgi:hypothetical protein